MSLEGDGEGALFVFLEEKEKKLGGSSMRISARHRIVVDGAACYDNSESERMGWPPTAYPIAPFRQPLVMPFFPWLALLRPRPPSTPPRVHHVSNYSNIARYPSIQGFASSLAQTQPSFSLASENVHVLSSPADFYARLIVRH
jgi:hypothetical protein